MLSAAGMTHVDVIVAVRNEEQNIPFFLDQIAALALPEGVDLRVMFVEDSSTDGTRGLLRRLTRENPKVGYYTLTRGFGQCPALAFGVSRSRADAVIMMDVDGSHPVRVIPQMIAGFLGGAKVVQCVRRSLANRRFYRRVGALLFFATARLLTGTDIYEQRIYYRLLSAEVARQMIQEPRYWHYVRFPLPRRPEGTLRKIDVDAEERVIGESKYDFWRLAKLGVDGMLSLIPPPRLALVMSLAVFSGVALIAVGLWPLAVVVGVPASLIVSRYVQLQRRDLVSGMQVMECGNVLG